MQNDYSNVCEIKEGQVKNAFQNLPPVIEDEKEAIKGANFLGIKNFGPEDMFIVNKDLSNKDKSITKKDADALYRYLCNMFEKNPETKHFGLFLYAGHGMIRDGTQYILLNQLDKKAGFYVMHSVELKIRALSKTCLNSYIVAIFACCRQNFSPKKHCGFLGRAVAEAQLKERDLNENMIEFHELIQQDSEELQNDETDGNSGYELFM